MLPLDTRQARIARRLLDGTAPTSVDTLATELDLTPRVVRYNLPAVEAFLLTSDVLLARRRGVGVWLEGEADSRTDLMARLDETVGPAVVDAIDRRARVIVALLDAFPEPVRLESLEVELGVSRPTVRRDVRAAEHWLEGHRVHLRRRPGVGIVVLGSETEIRGGLTADAYLDRIAFASIGTNDLLQYTLAADRGNPGVERYQDPLHPAALALIRSAVTSAERAGVELSVCGEMAGDPVGALMLVGLGVRSLSMSAPRIPAVRRGIRAAAQRDLEARALASLRAGTAAEARAVFAQA